MGGGYGEAAADVSSSYPTALRYVYDGGTLTGDSIVSLMAGQLHEIEVYGSNYVQTPLALRPGLFNSAALLAEPAVVMVPTESVYTYFSPNPDRVLETDRIGSIFISPNIVGTISVQYIIRWSVLNQANDPSEHYIYANDPFRVWLVSEPAVQYLQPKSITLRDANGHPVNFIQMTAGTTREFYVEVDDYLNDGIIENDFNYVSPENITYSANLTGSGAAVNATAVTDTPPLVLIHRTGNNLPTRLSTLKITALNLGGTQDSPYNDLYVGVSWGVTYLPSQQTVSTQTLSILITARDDAGGSYDDGGGTCNVTGLGSLALLLSLAFLRKSKR
jgi:hypothetical protein